MGHNGPVNDGNLAEGRNTDPQEQQPTLATENTVVVRHSIRKTFTFDAAHKLEWHTGKCRNLHGHTYRLEVVVAGELDAHGVVVDFDDVRTCVAEAVLEDYDHSYLNELIENPTAEMLCEDIARRLRAHGLCPSEITLWETPTSSATITLTRP